MTTIWILVAMCSSYGIFQPEKIEVETLAFKSAARCLRNVDSVKKQLLKNHDRVDFAECVERDLNE